MWRATIRKGMTKPFICECRDHELQFDEHGVAHRVPIRPSAKSLGFGSATAVSQSKEGAIASMMCVLEEQNMGRELLGKRDRA